MAIGIGGKGVKFEDTGYLSDESDFYGTHIPHLTQRTRLIKLGDEAMKQEFEARAQSFDPAEYWERKIPSLTEIANSNTENAKVVKAATLYNPYEGRFSGRQLAESVDDFLKRLPPATTSVTEILPWIFIANPYRKASNKDGNDQKNNEEAPPGEESDWAQFVILGNNLLEELTTIRHNIDKQKPGKAKGTITKAVTTEKDKIVKMLLDTAVQLHCTSGKVILWLIIDNSH